MHKSKQVKMSTWFECWTIRAKMLSELPPKKWIYHLFKQLCVWKKRKKNCIKIYIVLKKTVIFHIASESLKLIFETHSKMIRVLAFQLRLWCFVMNDCWNYNKNVVKLEFNHKLYSIQANIARIFVCNLLINEGKKILIQCIIMMNEIKIIVNYSK